MAAYTYPIAQAVAMQATVGVEGPLFAGAQPTPPAVLLQRDFRLLSDTTGTWTDRVVFKATPSSPEQPFANALVRVMRRADGYLAWAGYSDANGYYTATQLERGVAYVALAIDPRHAASIPITDPGIFKAVGAGPFTVPAA